MRVRQSLLGNADSCLRRLQFDIETPRDTHHSGVVRAVGTAYHAGLEVYYIARRDGVVQHWTLQQSFDAARDALVTEMTKAGEHFIWDEKFETFEAAEKAIRSMICSYFLGVVSEPAWDQSDLKSPEKVTQETLTILATNAWPLGFDVIGVEFEFKLPWYNGHERTGTIDLVLKDENGWIILDDHKTSGKKWAFNKHHPRKNNQVPWYTGAAREIWPEAPGHRFTFSVMTYKGEFERRIADATTGHIAAVESKALSVVALYTGLRSAGLDLPANPASTLCSPRYCDFFSVCPHGAALE